MEILSGETPTILPKTLLEQALEKSLSRIDAEYKSNIGLRTEEIIKRSREIQDLENNLRQSRSGLRSERALLEAVEFVGANVVRERILREVQEKSGRIVQVVNQYFLVWPVRVTSAGFTFRGEVGLEIGQFGRYTPRSRDPNHGMTMVIWIGSPENRDGEWVQDPWKSANEVQDEGVFSKDLNYSINPHYGAATDGTMCLGSAWPLVDRLVESADLVTLHSVLQRLLEAAPVRGAHAQPSYYQMLVRCRGCKGLWSCSRNTECFSCHEAARDGVFEASLDSREDSIVLGRQTRDQVINLVAGVRSLPSIGLSEPEPEPEEEESSSMTECENCLSEVDEDDISSEQTELGRTLGLCENCRSGEMMFCEECELYLESRPSEWLEGYGLRVCSTCLAEDFSRCWQCEKWVRSTDVETACDCGSFCSDTCQADSGCTCDG